jgi:hypothetical protein
MMYKFEIFFIFFLKLVFLYKLPHDVKLDFLILKNLHRLVLLSLFFISLTSL